MDPLDPLDAKQIVIEYARLLERDLDENRHPVRSDSLPYAKPLIKTAIRTSVIELAVSGHLTDELREYFETAYTSLADYLDAELVDLVAHYRESAEELSTQSPATPDKVQTTAWRTLVESSALAGEVARATSEAAAALRAEFRSFLESGLS